MPFYQKLGKIPHKRHTTFKKEDGGLHYEQLFGTEGFSGMSSLLYHLQRPTMVKDVKQVADLNPKAAVGHNITSRMLQGFKVPQKEDYLDSRISVLFNNDVHISLAAPTKSQTEYFYKNADADEMIFVHRGTGTLKTLMGNLRFGYGDYLVIPRGMIYQIHFDDADNRLFILDSYQPIYTPKRYRNYFGQLLEHSPFCERDMRGPEELEVNDEKGEFIIKTKKEGILHDVTYTSHPFDVVGWDGFNYPYAFITM